VSSSVSPVAWLVTAVLLVAMVALDLFVMGRRTGPITLATSLRWVALYVGLAVVFGVGLLLNDHQAGSEFFAGYLTEYSLSVDNLFVFMLIMAKFQVPLAAQDRALLIGIVGSLFMRAVLIAGGAALVSAASWAFYIFGALLIYTAVGLLREEEDEEFQEYAVLRLLRRVVPLSMDYDGARLRTRVDVGGRATRMWTPLMIVVASIAVANVVFALDSIPAILGLTQDTFVILTANAFALLGLRQLFFVVEGLLARLVYLKYGLAVVLGFIGFKLITEGLLGEHVDTVLSVPVPEISTALSLSVIGAALVLAAAASMLRTSWLDRHRESVAP
jgi:TerC family integral membrane protein